MAFTPSTALAETAENPSPLPNPSPLWRQHGAAFSPLAGVATVPVGDGQAVPFALTTALTAPVGSSWLRPVLGAPARSLSINPVVAAWLLRVDTGTRSPGQGQVDWRTGSATDQGHDASQALVGFGKRYSVPALLHYTRDDTKPGPELALSVSPGGPCTAACLKLAGSF